MKVLNSLDAVKLHPQPMDPYWGIKGLPSTMLGTIDRSRDGLAFSAIWTCKPSEFVWHYHTDEVIYVLEGRAYLTHNGTTAQISPGSVVHFEAGTKVHWVVVEPIRKLAIWRHSLPWPMSYLFMLCSRARAKSTGIMRRMLIRHLPQ
jgi:uncharacterized cupin superfamily protein